MAVRLTLDKAGRVVIPKPVRERAGLAPGDTLELEQSGETISLRPVRASEPLTREQGIWMWRTGVPLTARETDQVLDQVRAERKHTIPASK
ncbi:MAG: AbrB/MazE/SpoVT family DNA-binding domain-containing protein [Terriglobales bacterium]